MVSCIQSGLRSLTSQFCNVIVEVDEYGEDVLDRNGDPKRSTPKPRVELPYTYLVAWFVMHCPALMSAIPSYGVNVPFVQKLEGSVWLGLYSAAIRRTLQSSANYHLFRCFPDFPDAPYGERFQDTANREEFTSLSMGVFWWLINIRPGYLVFRQGKSCFIEPYFPCRFARQFGYDQLYVGNPNLRLSHAGDLFEGARAWYYFVTGCIWVTFHLPQKVPNLHVTLGFSSWYSIASSRPGYNINITCIKKIKAHFDSKVGFARSRLPGRSEFLDSEYAASDHAISEEDDPETGYVARST